ncbi:MAG: hypothetical protein AABY22_29060, partial [Nanoarchaeota archaeon]
EDRVGYYCKVDAPQRFARCLTLSKRVLLLLQYGAINWRSWELLPLLIIWIESPAVPLLRAHEH